MSSSAASPSTACSDEVYNLPHVNLEALVHGARGCRPLHRGVAGCSWTGSTAACGEDGCSVDPSQLSERHGCATAEPRAGKLALDSPHLRRLGLQPAHRDHDRQRRTAAHGVEHPDRRRPRPRGRAGRQQRRDVHHHAEQSGDRAQREDRRAALEIQAAAARRRVRAARHQSWRGAPRRQGLLRRRRGGARRARRAGPARKSGRPRSPTTRRRTTSRWRRWSRTTR